MPRPYAVEVPGEVMGAVRVESAQNGRVRIKLVTGPVCELDEEGVTRLTAALAKVHVEALLPVAS